MEFDILKDRARVQRAVHMATTAHKGQKRKYTGIPYITHPLQVARIVSKYTDDEDVIIAAILHDVVEDTKVTLKQVQNEFGDRVALFVHFVTKVTTKESGTRAFRQQIENIHLESGPEQSHLIKTADIIHNLSDIDESGDESFSNLYWAEKRETMKFLKKAPEGILGELQQMLDARFGDNSD